MLRPYQILCYLFCCIFLHAAFCDETLSQVAPGIDVLFEGKYDTRLRGKRIGLVTHYAAINRSGVRTIEMMKEQAAPKGYKLVALFAPEHGIDGKEHAEKDYGSNEQEAMPIYSLYGETRRPTEAMLKGIDLLIFDMQDVGCRSYTYLTTLCYLIEEAGKRKIPLMVLDRPNPINGLVVDGPMLEPKWSSFVSYCNVPYCHGMTLGELAVYFQKENKIPCEITVVPARGWKRNMTFTDTGLTWIPTSPNIPEATTPLYYPLTGILGELQITNIGIGYTLPFRVVAAPWIDGERFAKALNAQMLPGVHFFSFSLIPFFGKFTGKPCEGVLVKVTDPLIYKPVTTQYALLGILKSLYTKPFEEGLKQMQERKEMFSKINGTAKIYELLENDGFVIWKLRTLAQDGRDSFMQTRKRYLMPEYGDGKR